MGVGVKHPKITIIRFAMLVTIIPSIFGKNNGNEPAVFSNLSTQ